MEDIDVKYNWSDWAKFPDPRLCGYLHAPFGFGVYQLRNVSSSEYILFGSGNNLAVRMSSLLPKPLGQGTRNNEAKRLYVLENLNNIEYRTVALKTKPEMISCEKEIEKLNIHKFNT